MQIKDILNEFESDWAAMSCVEDEKLKLLKDKTFVICGHKIARCLCYALLYLNETKKLNINVILTGKSNEVMSDYNSELLLRNDFEFIDFNSLSEITEVNYVVFTGLCSENINCNTEVFKNEINSVKAVSEFAVNTRAKTVHLSDSRIYGKSLPHRVYSENEYGCVDIVSTDSMDTQLIRTIETFWSCKHKDNYFDLTVLRTGIVLGADTMLETDFDDIFSKIANKEKCSIKSSIKKYSFIYISDVLRAIVYALTVLKSNTVYNITGINSTVSTGMIQAILHDIYGENSEIALEGTGELNACAINSNKISAYGFKPQINLETALELCVMSKKKDHKIMRLPHSHDGRRSSIQNILLAYLLEVDRICRKHNIKYFLGGGTLLGAIRHHGFIPWDDDADIMMLREDYDKFCKIAQSELPGAMTFQTSETDKNCFYEFAKIRLDDTVFATSFAKNHKDMHMGLAFDIFCHDKTANSKFGQKLHLGMTLFTRALVFNKWNNRKAENDSKIQSAITNFFKALFPLKFSMWLEKQTLKFFKSKMNAKYLYDGMGKNIYNGVFPIDYLDEVIYVDFEGYKMPVPKKYDEYLTFLYGNYMELPPLSTRLGCHEIQLCDIGRYDGFKINKSW